MMETMLRWMVVLNNIMNAKIHVLYAISINVLDVKIIGISINKIINVIQYVEMVKLLEMSYVMIKILTFMIPVINAILFVIKIVINAFMEIV